MTQKWNYGDAWEQYPIEPGEVWGVTATNSCVAVHNIFEPLPAFMRRADLLFVDPPWNKGNINSFYTKAGRSDYLDDFSIFEQVLFQRIAEIAPRTCYLEVGFQAVDKWQAQLSTLYPHIQRWDVLYYRRNPCHILRGSQVGELDFDYTGMDEAKVIYTAGAIETYTVMGDMCMGLGLVGLSAHAAGKSFVGTELNKRRLANLLQSLAKQGASVEKYGETHVPDDASA